MQDISHLVIYLTTFILSGNSSKGNHHRVFVFLLKGPCLTPVVVRRMSLSTRMSAAKQLLEAVENLHKASIVHAVSELYFYYFS